MTDPIDIAARTAWGEARGEGTTGMQAVLNVIRNRADHPGWWGHDMASVCQCENQFSCWDAEDPNGPKARAVTDEDPLFRYALSMANKAQAHQLPDVTRGSDSYYATTSARPRWASGRTPQIIIGHHAFYRVGLIGNGL
ncbi:cell wall hydrolyse [Ameyamaea chiangmaiensis NBRC 103196]|uniref:Cell wall hydrolase n=1 Tax=Ameyamaea chiangmaiensis TaxID=442969 RepID=A0A850P661_9PROT|nr:cell wall hydrolase [Ameyamaea chiangmaiensis]MBS4074578.1 cell wall hydrolase [Ameyamaea chiangmaiensis]NVN39334.1 cell wall hydrolase [Ameyamaea chiangmaiensis]GBQ72549.1 cell wall hydrolyse [Ameyamaea chiangmaiensis NBRC 103196]